MLAQPSEHSVLLGNDCRIDGTRLLLCNSALVSYRHFPVLHGQPVSDKVRIGLDLGMSCELQTRSVDEPVQVVLVARNCMLLIREFVPQSLLGNAGLDRAFHGDPREVISATVL